MKLKLPFQIAYSSVKGNTHAFNEDGMFVGNHEKKDLFIGIVADGVGSKKAPYSQIGSRLLSNLIGHYLLSVLTTRNLNKKRTWENANKHLEFTLSTLAGQICMVIDRTPTREDANNILKEYFATTLVGIVITRKETVFFNVGDGVIFVNDKVVSNGFVVDGRPALPIHNIIGSNYHKKNMFTLEPVFTITTTELNRFALSTDGIEQALAGKGEQFIEDLLESKMFNNLLENQKPNPERFMLERRITMNRFDDDTTIITGKRI